MAERVWDRFLTEQDKAQLKLVKRTPVGWGRRPALLLIDNYRGVLGDAPEPLLGEVFLRKSSPSAFWGTPLAGHLNYLGVDTIIVCGESTSGCVRASVVEGCTYRYRMIVAEEACYDRHEACHAINLFDMNQKYADVVPLAEALDYLRRWQAERAPSVAS